MYAEDAEPAAALDEHARWRALVNRGDVQHEIAGVGRVAQYPLLIPDY
jgi:hypothetical protein